MISTLEALFQAWDEFKRGKRKKLDVQVFEMHLEDNLFTLSAELANKTYKHQPYSPFYIRDPKVRLIHKASVPDRIVHHLIFQALNPIFEPTFIYHSYSCRIGKGTHKGVVYLAKAARKIYKRHGLCFALKCDIEKFFNSINHQILYEIILRKLSDKDFLWLIHEIIESFESAPARERERERVNSRRLFFLEKVARLAI